VKGQVVDSSSKMVLLNTGLARLCSCYANRRQPPDFMGPEIWPPDSPGLNHSGLQAVDY